MLKEYKFYDKNWDIVKVKAHNRPEANKVFKSDNPEKNIKDYECIEPKSKKKNYIVQSFSEFEANEFKNRNV